MLTVAALIIEPLASIICGENTRDHSRISGLLKSEAHYA
jgi:hypothetical protein